MFLPAEIMPVMAHFRPAFNIRTYEKGVEVVLGAVLTQWQRTVTAALRAIGKGQDPQWSKYHHVLNRAQWSGLTVSRLLLQLLVATFAGSGGALTIAVDETLERRWGPQIRHCGPWRDSRASSKAVNVSTRGLRWLVCALVVNVPWTAYTVALPFLSVLLLTPKTSQQLGKVHMMAARVTGHNWSGGSGAPCLGGPFTWWAMALMP